MMNIYLAGRSEDMGMPDFDHINSFLSYKLCMIPRVSVQGVKSLGGLFACLCRGDFYEVKKIVIFQKERGKYFYTFNHFYNGKSSKREK